MKLYGSCRRRKPENPNSGGGGPGTLSVVYDCIVIGAGHNGLVCANELARHGWRVLVLERRAVVGGTCVTETPFPGAGAGYRVSTAAYVVSLLLPEIVRDYEMEKFGYRVLQRQPSSFTPFEDGRHLLLGADEQENARQIGKFSEKDAEAYPRYEALLTRIAPLLEQALRQTPPELLPLPATWRHRRWAKRWREAKAAYSLYHALGDLEEDLPEAIELMLGSASTVLDRYFESPQLKGTLATDAIVGTFAPPSAPGTAYVLLHHVMGSAGGKRGVWGYVEGGMGALTTALAKSAESVGVEVRTSSPVASIELRNEKVAGVRLADGELIETRFIASNADANVTFLKLLDARHLPENFRGAVQRIDYSSASMKINLGLREPPRFSCFANDDENLASLGGTVHINAMPDQIERAYADARLGEPSRRPIIEMTIPSTLDTTLAPPGHHVASLFVQYAPYKLAEGDWDAIKEGFADRCIDEVTRYAPNFRDAVLHRQVLSPLDLEREFSLTGGNIFQGAMSLHQLFSLRPVPGWADYRTPITGLYLCGAAAHPGGGVMGACGLNAAREMLRDGHDV